MSQATLYAISPLDGRYRGRLNGVSAYYSEYAYIKYRIRYTFIRVVNMEKEISRERETKRERAREGTRDGERASLRESNGER